MTSTYKDNADAIAKLLKRNVSEDVVFSRGVPSNRNCVERLALVVGLSTNVNSQPHPNKRVESISNFRHCFTLKLLTHKLPF